MSEIRLARAALREIRSANDVPAGAVLVASLTPSVEFRAPVRWGWQVHWLKDAAQGLLEGLTGVRADGSAEAEAEVSWQGLFRAEVTMDEQRLRLRLFRESTSALSARVNLKASAGQEPDELARALSGTHSLGWLRSMLNGSGSAEWKAAAERAGVATQVLEDLTGRWLRLGPEAQAALFGAGASAQLRESIRAWCHRVADEAADPAALHRMVSEWPWHGEADAATVLDWLEGAAGCPLDLPLDAEPFARLKAAASEAHALLAQPALAEALSRMCEAALAIEPAVRKGVESLAGELASRASAALEKRLTAELAWRASAARTTSALVDASYEFTEAGLEAYRRTLDGDLTPALAAGAAGVAVRQAVLAYHVRRRMTLELHLPFIKGKREDLGEAFAKVEISTDEAGRTVAVSMEAEDATESRGRYASVLAIAGAILVRGTQELQTTFRLAFEDHRTIKPGPAAEPYYEMLKAYGLSAPARAWVDGAGGPVDASLTLHAPGDLVAGWIGLPSEREEAFFERFRRASMAVQAALRVWLPACWFADVKHYEDLDAAYPLLLYQATDPFPGRPRTEFTYDVLDADSMERAWRSAGRHFRGVLERVRVRLNAAGMEHAAEFYAKDRAGLILGQMQRHPRLFHALLSGDRGIVNQLSEIASTGRDLRALLQRDPAKAAREFARFGDKFTHAFRRKLRRLYAAEGFEALGSLLLVVATAALNRGAERPVQAVLRLRCGGKELVLG